MFVFDYSECSDLISEIITATEGDLVYEVMEELSNEGLYMQRASTGDLVRFCKKVLTVGIVTAIVYNKYREEDTYYETMFKLIVSTTEGYITDMVEMDTIYEEDDIAYTSDWTAFVPSDLPFNIRNLEDVMDIAEIVAGQVLDVIHAVDFYEDPEFKRAARMTARSHGRTMGDCPIPPELEIDIPTRSYTLTPPRAPRRKEVKVPRPLRH